MHKAEGAEHGFGQSIDTDKLEEFFNVRYTALFSKQETHAVTCLHDTIQAHNLFIVMLPVTASIDFSEHTVYSCSLR